jgi:anaerobic magnesium-protoporphyrin IX monomethyl ester cyclase
MKISIISPNLSGDPSIVDIGITYLATWINERTTHRARILDFTYHARDWREHLERHIERYKPDVIGISTVSMYMQYVEPMIQEIKQRWGLPIILGGYHATLLPEPSIALPGVDAVCIGDGEVPLTAWLDALEGGGSAHGIDGLWFMHQGEVVRNELRPLNQDIDELPIPNYDLWEDFDRFLFYNGVVYVIGNRGCPYGCTYCSEEPLRQRLPGRYLRTRDPAAYAREIQHHWRKYRHRGMRVAHTFDPAFTVNEPWLEAFCTAYREIGLADVLPFSCFSRADQLDEHKVELLAAANVGVVRIGIPSPTSSTARSSACCTNTGSWSPATTSWAVPVRAWRPCGTPSAS